MFSEDVQDTVSWEVGTLWVGCYVMVESFISTRVVGLRHSIGYLIRTAVCRLFTKRGMASESANFELGLKSVLSDVFGHHSFREGQLEASKAILSNKDVFVRLKTSGGKSLCYLLPALLLNGVCVIISPLISLMHDQVGVVA